MKSALGDENLRKEIEYHMAVSDQNVILKNKKNMQLSYIIQLSYNMDRHQKPSDAEWQTHILYTA